MIFNRSSYLHLLTFSLLAASAMGNSYNPSRNPSPHRPYGRIIRVNRRKTS